MNYQNLGYDSRLRKQSSLIARRQEYLTPLQQEIRFERNPYAPPTLISKGTVSVTNGGLFEVLNADQETVLGVDSGENLVSTAGGLSVAGTTNLGSSVAIGGTTSMAQDVTMMGSAVVVDKNMVFQSQTNGNSFMSILNAGGIERTKVEINANGFGFITADEYLFKSNSGNSLGEFFGVKVTLADASGGHALRVYDTNDAAVWTFASNGEAYQSKAGFVELLGTIADPGGGPSNTARLYVKDNGAGKLQLAVEFPTGAAQVLATQP